MEVGPQQVHALLPDGAEPFRRDHSAVLLLQHHPEDWMASPKQWRSHVASAAHAVLVGHMHEHGSEVRREESNEDRPVVQSRSLCGLEHCGKAEAERRFGYRWGRAHQADFGADGWCTELRSGARTLVEREHRWAFTHPTSEVSYEEDEGMLLTRVPMREPPRGKRGRRTRRRSPESTPRTARLLAVLAVMEELGPAAEACAGSRW